MINFAPSAADLLNRMAPHIRVLVFVLVALFPVFAESADTTPWYQVEIIVFSRPGAPLDAEAWPVEATPPPSGRELAPWSGGTQSVLFQQLPASALQLKRDFDRMRASSDLRPLLHMAWLQPGLAREQAIAVHVGTEPNDGGWVDGSVRLVLSRYLHLETNLIYHRRAETEVGEPVFQLIESRRMRSREYHYLDHPLFGVLAVVTPYEPGARKPRR